MFDPLEPKAHRIQHVDKTATQGFERASDNIIFVWPNDCPQCLLPFNRAGAKSWRIKVYAEDGYEDWCSECAEKGISKGICIKYRSLNKKERKILNRHAKKQSQ